MLKNRGFSLIEILISLALGSLLVFLIINLYITIISTGLQHLKLSRLQAHLFATFSIIEKDVRRAGYGGEKFLVGVESNRVIDTYLDGGDEDEKIKRSCIIYSYNNTLASQAESKHRMGFRLDNTKQEIQFGTGVAQDASLCYSQGYWLSLTNRKFMKITLFKIDEIRSQVANGYMHSVEIELSGMLATDSQYQYTIKKRINVRNFEMD